jgi:hypothetical protein
MRPSCLLSASKRIRTPNHLPLASLQSHRHPCCCLAFQPHCACQGMMLHSAVKKFPSRRLQQKSLTTPSLSAPWTPLRMIPSPHQFVSVLFAPICSTDVALRLSSALARRERSRRIRFEALPFAIHLTTTILGSPRSTTSQPLSLLHLLVEC